MTKLFLLLSFVGASALSVHPLAAQADSSTVHVSFTLYAVDLWKLDTLGVHYDYADSVKTDVIRLVRTDKGCQGDSTACADMQRLVPGERLWDTDGFVRALEERGLVQRLGSGSVTTKIGLSSEYHKLVIARGAIGEAEIVGDTMFVAPFSAVSVRVRPIDEYSYDLRAILTVQPESGSRTDTVLELIATPDETTYGRPPVLAGIRVDKRALLLGFKVSRSAAP